MKVDRFDLFCRSEKFFSATLLPSLFFRDNFEGLKLFVRLLDAKKYFPTRGRSCEPEKGGYDSILKDPDWRNVHFATEVHLDRDLAYYKVPISPNAFQRKKGKQQAPDIVAVIGDIIIVIECKVYENYHEHSIYEQLDLQKYIFDVLTDFYGNENMGKVHVCIVPDDIRVSNGYVVTWKEVFDFYKDTRGADFVLGILRSHVERLYDRYR